MIMGNGDGIMGELASTQTTTTARGGRNTATEIRKIVPHETAVTATPTVSVRDLRGALRLRDALAPVPTLTPARGRRRPPQRKTRQSRTLRLQACWLPRRTQSRMRTGRAHCLSTMSLPKRASLSSGGVSTCSRERNSLVRLIPDCAQDSFDVCFLQSCYIYIVRARTSSAVTARSLTYPSNIRRARSNML
jgi:hypothetical protein